MIKAHFDLWTRSGASNSLGKGTGRSLPEVWAWNDVLHTNRENNWAWKETVSSGGYYADPGWGGRSKVLYKVYADEVSTFIPALLGIFPALDSRRWPRNPKRQNYHSLNARSSFWSRGTNRHTWGIVADHPAIGWVKTRIDWGHSMYLNGKTGIFRIR